MTINKQAIPHFIFFGTIIILAISCKNISRNKVELPPVANAYNYNGINKDYKIDPEKKKVISYIAPLYSFRTLLEQTPAGKIDRIIKDNPNYEFIFYCDQIAPDDTTEFKQLLARFNCRFSVILDFNDDLYKLNKRILNPVNNGRLSKISLICDQDNRVLDYAVIGTSMSFFDKVFAKYR